MSKTNDEALARLEHKVDFLLAYILRLTGPQELKPMGDNSHNCPVCMQPVKYVVDMQENSVGRICGCKTGKFAPIDLGAFAPPLAAGGKQNGNEGDATSVDVVDRERGQRKGSNRTRSR